MDREKGDELDDEYHLEHYVVRSEGMRGVRRLCSKKEYNCVSGFHDTGRMLEIR